MCLQIIHVLCEVLDKKQMKLVKYAKPAMQHIQTLVGGGENLKTIAVKAYNYTRAHQMAAEENKDSSELSEEEQQKIVIKVGKAIDSLSAKKKAAPRAGGMRAFMKTAKNDLSQMTAAPEVAVSMAAYSMNEGFGT